MVKTQGARGATARLRTAAALGLMAFISAVVAADDGVAPPRSPGQPAEAVAAAPQPQPVAIERIVAVGDVHGDYAQLVRALRAAEVIDAEGKWIGGKTHLVQTGDVFDRGPDSRKAMDLLMRLEEEAARAGGAVHALIGNHEAMVLAGQWSYLTAEEIDSFGGEEEFRKAVGPEGKYGRWIRSHDAVLKLNDVLFVHGGLRASWADKSLKEINDAVRQELAESKMEGAAGDPSGPLWDRRYSLDESPEVIEELEAVLRRHGARVMVVGHTVTRERVAVRCQGRLVCIDVGMSAAYGGPAACLVIDQNGFREVSHDRPPRRLEVRAPAAVPAAPTPVPVTPQAPVGPSDTAAPSASPLPEASPSQSPHGEPVPAER